MDSPTFEADGDNRNRQPRGERRRQQILDTAVQLFASRGFRGTGVAALAEEVGMTAPGVLYYFGTKERLLREVLAERDRVDRYPQGERVTLDALRHIGVHYARTMVVRRLFQVLASENLDPGDPLHDFFVERYAEDRAILRRLLLEAQADGTIRTGIAVDSIATEILAVSTGLTMQWLMDPDAIDIVGEVHAYADRLFASLAGAERDSMLA